MARELADMPLSECGGCGGRGDRRKGGAPRRARQQQLLLLRALRFGASDAPQTNRDLAHKGAWVLISSLLFALLNPHAIHIYFHSPHF